MLEANKPSAQIERQSDKDFEAKESTVLEARIPSGPIEQQWYGKTMVISGTVSRVDVHGQFPTWITVYLKESPDNAIVICSAAPDIFTGRFGRGYATSLVGRTIEVQGPVGGAMCDNRAKASIQITMSKELRIR